MNLELRTAPHLADVEMPENLAIGLMISEHRQRCRASGCSFDYVAYALGQSPFPVPGSIVTALADAATHGEYVPAVGIDPLQEAIAGFWQRHFAIDLPVDRIVVVPGAKYALLMIIAMLEGPLIVPAPAWVGYLPIARLFQKDVIPLTTTVEDGYKVSPEALETLAQSLDAEQKLLIINSPNNPTGAVYTRDELTAIADVARRNGIIVISDEIYALSTYDFSEFASMAEVYPEGTFVVSGMSKYASAGGSRLGVAILPTSCAEEQRFNFRKLGSATYANVATPIQHAAIAAFADSAEMNGYIDATREIHRIMGQQLQRRFQDLPGMEVLAPRGAFYFFADFNALRERVRASGISGSRELMHALLDHPHHVAMLAGESCLMPADDLSFRVAFVDYDGAAALDAYRERPPRTGDEESAFVERYAPRMVDGVARLRAWIASL